MNAYKDRVAETERVKERKRARVVRGAGDVPMEPGNEERMAGRHAVASGEDIRENQHEDIHIAEDERQHDENRMRDIHRAVSHL